MAMNGSNTKSPQKPAKPAKPDKSNRIGLKAVLPGFERLGAVKPVSGHQGGFLAFELPESLARFFAEFGAANPICPNCRELLNLIRVDELTGNVHCGQCDQLLAIPDAAVRFQLLVFMEQSGLAAALHALNRG